MNFDDIKAAWDNESTENIKVPETVELIGKANHPIEKIRKNMKHEFKWQLISIIFLGVVPLIAGLNFNLCACYYALYAMLILICGYYFYKFHLLFKYIHNYNADTKDNLYEMYYTIKLNMEIYWSFTFALMPFICGMVGLLCFQKILAHGMPLSVAIHKYLLISAGLVVFLIIYFMVATKWWINRFYGKYVKKIKQVLDDLKEQ